MREIAVALILGMTLVGLFLRPRGIGEWGVTAVGAMAMIAAGAVSIDAVPGILGSTRDVLLFLAGMMILTGIAERAGVFGLLADWAARLSGQRGRVLYIAMFLLAAAITATLSLDVTVIVLTPIVYALTTRRRIDPLPFLFGCVFVANTGSLVLPVSNLTNLVVYHGIEPGFGTFASVMWLPNMVAVLVNLLVFLWVFRDRIPHRLEVAAEDAAQGPPAGGWIMTSAVVLVATLIGLSVLGISEYPLWWASVGGAGLLLVLAWWGDRICLGDVWRDLSPSLFIFVTGMTVIVAGVERTWLDGWTPPLPGGMVGQVAVAAGAGAIGSAIVNNLPMAVFATHLIERVGPSQRDALAYGTLVGANIGPALTTFGSLATIIWLTLVRRYGLVVTTGMYMRVSLVTIPPTLLAAGTTLVVVLAVR